MSSQQADRIGVRQIEVVGDLGVEQQPWWVDRPLASAGRCQASRQPASLITYGMVAFVRAYGRAGTAPGMFATQ
jgi:hypothetical protein